MNVRKEKCQWCKKMYAVKDSNAPDRFRFCSKKCEAEYDQAHDDCDKWWIEITNAWNSYVSEYEPEEDEELPCVLWSMSGANKKDYLAFKKRYLSWKRNHCWKKSFWEEDESSDSSSSEGGSGGCGGGSGSGGRGGGSSSGGGIGKTILNLIILAVIVWLGWKGVKGVWNRMFSSGGEVDIMATITESWENHLDQRREAFEDGLSENEVEAKGLRNYTLAEWEEKCLKEQEAKKQAEMKKAAEDEKEKVSATQKAKDIGKEALSTVKGLGSKAKGFLHKITE